MTVRIGLAASAAANSGFDVTPARLLTCVSDDLINVVKAKAFSLAAAFPFPRTTSSTECIADWAASGLRPRATFDGWCASLGRGPNWRKE